MDQKAFVEGGRAFLYWAATLIDAHARAGDAEAHALVSLLTPVVKGFLTDKGFETAVAGAADLRRPRLHRGDRRQPVRPRRPHRDDLRGRQRRAGPRPRRPQARRRTAASRSWPSSSWSTASSRRTRPTSALKAGFLDPLKAASKDLQSAAEFFLQNIKTPNAALAGSTDFLHLFGHVCLGYMWARMAKAALGQTDDFHAAKLATGRYYMARLLPATALHLARIRSGAEPVMALPAEAF